jgi:Tfp pilus assembly protein PilO
MRLILSIIMVLASIGGFIAYIVPTYTDAKTIGVQKTEYLDLLANARLLVEKRDQLLQKYNNISPSDIAKLEKMLPANPDNVKLILEIDALAKTQGLVLQNVKIQDAAETDAKNQKPATRINPDIGTLTLDFTTSGSYTAYVNFIQSLERDLRIMNLKKISFIAPEDKNTYQYQTSVETYWVK